MRTMAVTVIVPVYNAAEYLEEALNSIRRQSLCPEQIIVVDDGSTDGSADIAREVGKDILVIQQRNLGPGSARNRGLELATGSHIGFLDADDFWEPECLALQLSRLSLCSRAQIAWGLTAIEVCPGGRRHSSYGPGSHRIVSVGSMLFHRDVFSRTGKFAEDIRFGEDSDLWIRVREQDIGIVQHDAIVQTYRRHANNMTNTPPAAFGAFFDVARLALARRRQQSNWQVETKCG
jgi:glycosyltransferase involved in cell wall biosynthesis